MTFEQKPQHNFGLYWIKKTDPIGRWILQSFAYGEEPTWLRN